MAPPVPGSVTDLLGRLVPPSALEAARSAGLDLADPVVAEAFADGVRFAGELLAEDDARGVESAA
ncbi:hypothetical protein WME90_01745 [Sorangium sp. So ce375]|uniref:hypothetical protein n=1 Tax=Sorangium sp. So ce375 TaxID=3133306 RepID=UPI003F5AEFC9